ncbi:hypothetical protein NQD34_013607 [Periophthalmus magnuspinnatus]|nr:hypothetical protein NQD34_013607 [Periophthalmus magnuspinnatus]
MGRRCTYYCGTNKDEYLDFSAGTVVVVEGESRSMQSVVQSPDYIKVQPGDSVTLSCSFNTNLCPKENPSITWIKSGSASQMASWNTGIMSTSCEKRDTGEISCVSNLPLIWKDISSAEDETYFCVVTVCGHMLLGTGTRIKHGNDPQSLSLAGVVLTVVCVAFAVTVLVLVRLMRKNKKQTTGTYVFNSQKWSETVTDLLKMIRLQIVSHMHKCLQGPAQDPYRLQQITPCTLK